MNCTPVVLGAVTVLTMVIIHVSVYGATRSFRSKVWTDHFSFANEEQKSDLR